MVEANQAYLCEGSPAMLARSTPLTAAAFRYFHFVDNSRGSSNYDIQFARVDDTSVIEQFGLYTHESSRHVIADGKDQIDIQVIAHAGLAPLESAHATSI